jgi:hypothetical protein
VSCTSATLTALFEQGNSTGGNSDLDNAKTVIDLIGTLITAAAVIIGGIWAYFKFVKGRTFRPRLEVNMSGQWVNVDEKQLLQARIRVKNIGASKVTLLQEGTGLRVSVLAARQPSAPAAAVWDRRGIFEILKEHAWIEPLETVSDDLLLDLGRPNHVPTLFETRLVWRRRAGNIQVFARQLIPSDAKINGFKDE